MRIAGGGMGCVEAMLSCTGYLPSVSACFGAGDVEVDAWAVTVQYFLC